MATLEINKETKVNESSNLSFSCRVVLEDNKQILIDLEEREWQGGNLVPTGVLKKVRLEELNYSTDYKENTVHLNQIEVRGFKKDGGLRYRSEYVYHLEQKTIDQIPDEYHDYAREAFAKEMVRLQEELTTMTNKGVRIGTKQSQQIRLV
jgi:hypothetical protein